MKKLFLIILFFGGLTFNVNSQNIDSMITKLTGKWVWVKTYLGGFAGGYATPQSEGYEMSVILYQDSIYIGTDSMQFVSLKNDSITCTGVAKIMLDINNDYQITPDIVLCGANGFYNKIYNLDFVSDSTFWFNDIGVEAPDHKYMKDKSYILNTDNNPLKNLSVNIFPNPVKSCVNIELTNFDRQNIKVNIINSFGQIVLTKQLIKRMNLLELNISNLKTGIYTVQIIGEDKIINKNIIKY